MTEPRRAGAVSTRPTLSRRATLILLAVSWLLATVVWKYLTHHSWPDALLNSAAVGIPASVVLYFVLGRL